MKNQYKKDIELIKNEIDKTRNLLHNLLDKNNEVRFSSDIIQLSQQLDLLLLEYDKMARNI